MRCLLAALLAVFLAGCDPTKCVSCGGLGRADCMSCEGGQTDCGTCMDGRTDDARCVFCKGKGAIVCHTCDGKGERRCYTCNGAGK